MFNWFETKKHEISSEDFVQKFTSKLDTIEKDLNTEEDLSENDAEYVLSELAGACREELSERNIVLLDDSHEISEYGALLNGKTIIVNKELSDRVYGLTDKLICSHDAHGVDWDSYVEVCKTLPEATILWRNRAGRFQLNQGGIEKAHRHTPNFIAEREIVSDNQAYCIGAPVGNPPVYPIAKYSVKKQDVIFFIEEFAGNRGEICAQMEGDQVSPYEAFMDRVKPKLLEIRRDTALTPVAG